MGLDEPDWLGELCPVFLGAAGAGLFGLLLELSLLELWLGPELPRVLALEVVPATCWRGTRGAGRVGMVGEWWACLVGVVGEGWPAWVGVVGVLGP